MQCPKCRQEHKGKDNFCYHCGADIPQNVEESMPLSSGNKLSDKRGDKLKCPECNATNPVDAEICNLCGKILIEKNDTPPAFSPEPSITEHAAESSVIEEQGQIDLLQEKDEKIRALIIGFLIAGTIVVVLGAAAFVVSLTSDESLGVSKENPLGDFKTIDKYLLAKEFDRDEPRSVIDFDLVPDARIYRYAHTSLLSGKKDELIILFLDSEDNILAVGVSFISTHVKEPYTASLVSNFNLELWQAVTGAKPTFKDVEGMRNSMFTRDWFVATFENDTLDLSWIKKRYDLAGNIQGISEVKFIRKDAMVEE